MKKILLLALLFLLSIGIVNAGLDCSHDNTSYYSEFNKIDMLCVSEMYNYQCLSFVRNMSGALLSVNPSFINVKDVGRIEHFQSYGQVVKIEFRPMPNIIRPKINYTYGVICSNGTAKQEFNTTLKPLYKELDIVTEKTIYLKDNLPYLFLIFIVSLVLIAIFLVALKKARGA